VRNSLVVVATLAVTLWATPAESGFYTPTVTCPCIDRPYWMQPLIRNDGKAVAAHNSCTAIRYDDAALYVEPSWEAAMDQLAEGIKTADGRLAREAERIRIFLKPDRDSADVYEISVSASCQVREVRWQNGRPDESWSAGATARNTYWGGASYTNEITIPFNAFGGRPEPGTVWGLNVAREEAASGEHSNWAGVVGDENLLRKFGLLRFASPDEAVSVGLWILPRPLKCGTPLRLSYRFNLPEGSAVSRMLISDGGEVFEPSGSQMLEPAPAPSWRPHYWSLPRGMPLSVQFAVTKDETVYCATAPIPVPENRVDETARRLSELYADLVSRASALRNEQAKHAFMEAVTPVRQKVEAISTELDTILRKDPCAERSSEINKAAGLVETPDRRAHLLGSALEVFEALDEGAEVPAFGVGHTHSLVKLRRFQSEVEYGTPLRIELARRERESAQLVVVPFDRALRGVSAEWTDLVGPAGNKFVADNIRIDVVGYVKTTPGGYPAPWIGWWPDPLMPLQPTDVPVDSIQPLWITAYAPPGTAAGVYRGQITVSTANAGSVDVPLEVEVWDFDLPLRGKFKTAIAVRFTRDITGWYGFEGVENAFDSPGQIPREFRLKVYDFLLEHRINPCALFERHTMPEKEDVQYCVERGMNAVVMLIPPGEVNEEVIEHVRGWRDFLKERGWLDLLYIFGYDEAADRPDIWSMMEEERPKLKALFPEIPIALTGTYGDISAHPEWDSFIDIWIPTVYSYNHEEWDEHRSKTGDTVWWYTADSPGPFAGMLLDMPAIKHRILFWQNFKYGVPGYLYYLITGWRANVRNPGKPRWPDIPWITASFNGTINGGGQWVYPGKDGLLSSLRLEIIRDGIEDYETFAVLEELTEQLEATGTDVELVQANRRMLQVPAEVVTNLREYTHDPVVLLAQRQRLADQIIKTRQRLSR